MRNWRLGEKKRKLKKIKKDKKFKLTIIIYFFIIICVLYNVLFLINTTISQKKYFKIWGVSLFCVKTELMEDDLSKNDLVIVCSDDNYQTQDVIAYEVNNQIRINKIVYFDENKYVTKYNKTFYSDIENIHNENIIGKVVVSVPFLGLLLELLQSKFISILLLICLIFIYSYNRYVFTKSRERKRKKKKFGGLNG